MSLSPSLLSALESLLFLSGEPMSVLSLSKILKKSEDETREALERLAKKYTEDTESGIMLIFHDKSVRLTTKPENSEVIETLTKSTLQESLSRAALEVLTIIAYRSPITRSEIESIRGVNCSFTLRNLLLRGLIERSGNPSDARGYIYSPSFRLLETLGLESVAKLPDYETLSQDERLQVLLGEEEKENQATKTNHSPEQL